MPQLDNGRDIVIDAIKSCLKTLLDHGVEVDEKAIMSLTANWLLGRIASIGRDVGERKADLRLAHDVAVAYVEIVEASEMKDIIHKLLQPVN